MNKLGRKVFQVKNIASRQYESEEESNSCIFSPIFIIAVCSREPFPQSLSWNPIIKNRGGRATEARAEELKVAGEAGEEGGKDRGRLRPRWGAREVHFPLFLTSHSLSLADIILQYPDRVYFKVHKKIMVLLPAQHSVHTGICLSVASPENWPSFSSFH